MSVRLPRALIGLLGVAALVWFGLSAPGQAGEPAPACGGLGAVPDAVQVAWISPSAKQISIPSHV